MEYDQYRRGPDRRRRSRLSRPSRHLEIQMTGSVIVTPKTEAKCFAPTAEEKEDYSS